MRTVGQYSEAVQILVSRLRGAKPEARKSLSVALFKGLLAKDHNGKVKSDIHRLLLDIYPEIQEQRYYLCPGCFNLHDKESICNCGRTAIDYYEIYFGAAEPKPVNSPVRTPVPPTESPDYAADSGPTTRRNPADLSRRDRSRWNRQQPIFRDPAQAVLNRKSQDEVYEAFSEEAYNLCYSILKEFANLDFCPGFYPFPVNPITKLEDTEGTTVYILILSSATVEINGKLHFVHPEVNGDILKADHNLIVRASNGAPIELFVDLPNGEKRCVRAIKYKDRSIIRYWLHEVGGSDIEEGEVIFEVRGEKVVQINKNEYWRSLVKMGKRRPKK